MPNKISKECGGLKWKHNVVTEKRFIAAEKAYVSTQKRCPKSATKYIIL
jgi:hypothetical protein